MPERKALLETWLRNDCDLAQFSIETASADASFRRYFRITLNSGQTRIAMDAPPEQEDCQPFIDVTKRLLTAGVHVPEIFAHDLSQGFILLEDLGNDTYLPMLTDSTADGYYAQAMDAMLNMQSRADVVGLPVYDEALLRREMDLFPEWLLGKHLQLVLTDEETTALQQCFDVLVESALEQPQYFVHRDYHSRNLMVVSDNSPGVIDYQDAVNGPPTYDLVSLLKDCYIDWPLQQVDAWALSYLVKAKNQKLISNDITDDVWLNWFDLMGVQRHLKAAGIFARLNHRDGKSGYMADIPRTLRYILAISSRRPALSALADLIEHKVLPPLTQ